MIESLVRGAAMRWPDRAALVDGSKVLSFRELSDRVSRLAHGLLSLGLETGDRLIDLQLNSHSYVEADLACAVAGIVRVPVNTRLSVQEICYIAEDSRAAALVVGPEFQQVGEEIAEEAADIRHVIGVSGAAQGSSTHDFEALIQDGRSERLNRWTSPGDLVSINYSSGTTGAPKGCRRTIRNRISSLNAVLVTIAPSLGSSDSFLHAGPLTHASGLFMLPHLVAGSTQVLMRKFDAELVPKLVAKHGITGTVLVPTMLERVLDSVADRGMEDLASLRRVAYAGAPMAPDRITRAVEILGERLVQFYGMVEAIPPLTVLRSADHADPELLRSAGLPVPGVAPRVVGNGGESLRPGETGEVLISGDQVMPGYWSNGEATAKSLTRGGWLRTGDVGCLDERGYLFLMDRRADMIISGGFNIMPREIEDVLTRHAGVQDVAVVGIPDREWGEVVVAFVVPTEPHPDLEADLRELCEQSVAAYKKPKWFEFVEALPKGATGKISRRALRSSASLANSRAISQERPLGASAQSAARRRKQEESGHVE